MWYRYKDKLIDLSPVFEIYIDSADNKVFPYRMVFLDAQRNNKYILFFKSEEEANKELTNLYKRLPKK